jgi:hypothetical protein
MGSQVVLPGIRLFYRTCLILWHDDQIHNAMKTFLSKITLLVSLSPLLLPALSLNAQYIDISYPGKGYPVMLRYYENGQIQRFAVPDVDKQPIVRINSQDATIDFDLSFIKKEGQSTNLESKDQVLEFYEPGQPIEADFPIDIKFTKDGNIFAVVYEHSDNVIFYSTATYEILADVEVVRKPISLTMADEHAYVCCHQGQGIVVISLEDFSITNFVEVDGTPFQVGVSPGEDTAYIACDPVRLRGYGNLQANNFQCRHRPDGNPAQLRRLPGRRLFPDRGYALHLLTTQ